jgi:hypothetical protein
MSILAEKRVSGHWRPSLSPLVVSLALALALTLSQPVTSFADEDGVSFWIPGLFGSLAAAPQHPGWSVTVINYFDSVSASRATAAAREITIGKLSQTVNANFNLNLKVTLNFIAVDAGYVFATPVLGGQLNLAMLGLMGPSTTALNGSLTLTTGPVTIMREGGISQTTTGFGDLYPQAIVRWNNGVHNWMVYGTGDIPVGDYSSTNLANTGIGHGAADAGGGYTYFDEKLGHEFSAVSGFTYNLINPSTNYRNGIDWHLDWGASQFVSKTVFIGAVGYFYEQVSPDSGCHPQLCPFESGVIGVGPQMGVIMPIGDVQLYANVKAYGEFDAHNRPSGFNTWLTFSFSPLPPTNPKAAVLTK